MTLKDIKPNPRNPRSITEGDLDALGESLDEYGDLSGFVFNRDGTIISAHQRWKNIKGKVKDFVVSETFEAPLPDGTIQRGHFELKDGRKYDYAVRDWPKEKADAATIRANRQNAGTWDAGILGQWDLTPAELIEFGVPEFVFGEDAGETMQMPGNDELIGEEKDKPPTMKITFPTPDDLQRCEAQIQEVINRLCPDAFYSVSAGEI